MSQRRRSGRPALNDFVLATRNDCPICGKEYENVSRVEKHFKRRHENAAGGPMSALLQQEKKFKCAMCFSVYGSKNATVTHYKTIHPDEYKENFAEFIKEKTQTSKDKSSSQMEHRKDLHKNTHVEDNTPSDHEENSTSPEDDEDGHFVLKPDKIPPVKSPLQDSTLQNIEESSLAEKDNKEEEDEEIETFSHGIKAVSTPSNSSSNNIRKNKSRNAKNTSARNSKNTSPRSDVQHGQHTSSDHLDTDSIDLVEDVSQPVNDHNNIEHPQKGNEEGSVAFHCRYGIPPSVQYVVVKMLTAVDKKLGADVKYLMEYKEDE